MRIGCAMVIGCVAFHVSAVGQGQETSDHYYYFKEPRPLQLDTTAVAIFDKASSVVSVASRATIRAR